jgi:hypothetical protein
VGAGLARDRFTSVIQLYRGVAIAGKPAPTRARSHSLLCVKSELAFRSFPRSRVGMQPVTLCVTPAQNMNAVGGTRSVPGGIPTQSVGTI